MATLKHINSKNADYGAAEQYLLFEHGRSEEHTSEIGDSHMTGVFYTTGSIASFTIPVVTGYMADSGINSIMGLDAAIAPGGFIVACIIYVRYNSVMAALQMDPFSTLGGAEIRFKLPIRMLPEELAALGKALRMRINRGDILQLRPWQCQKMVLYVDAFLTDDGTIITADNVIYLGNAAG